MSKSTPLDLALFLEKLRETPGIHLQESLTDKKAGFVIHEVKGDIDLQSKPTEKNNIKVQVLVPGVSKDQVIFNRSGNQALTIHAPTPFGEVKGTIIFTSPIGKITNISLVNGIMEFEVEAEVKSSKIEW